MLVSMVTEVRGFTDQQKDEFFMKKFKDQATDVIKHIKKSRSLYIMCHIAVFCWILSDVLLHLMKPKETAELPTSLTQMYVHFLVVQAKVQNTKYKGGEGSDDPWTPETKEMVWSLGKLAFEKLLEGKLIFYKTELSECGLDAEDIAHYSVFKELLKTEPGQGDDKVYCFIHLSLQEFLAALHVHQTFFISGVNLLSSMTSESSGSYTATLINSFFQKLRIKDSPEFFYRCAVDQALQSPNGHLDLFLRFLLGLSLPTNQEMLQGLLTQTGSDSTNQKTVKYLKQKLNECGVSSEKKLNLLYCLNELNDHSLLEEIHKVLREEEFSDRRMSPADWSALSFILLSSDSDLEEFDLRKYRPSEEALLGLQEVLKVSTKAILSSCFLTENICAPLASVLVSSSSLKHLDLSNNDLQDSGVELLCEGLKSGPCRLDTLRLSGCMVAERGVACLAAALNPASSPLSSASSPQSSALSSLRDLDLSYNHPRAFAQFLKKLQAPHGPLYTLRLAPAGKRFLVPGLRKYACEFSLDPNTAYPFLRLSEDLRSVRKVEEFQKYPDHQDRFTGCVQVLSSSGLRGLCYWEVDWRVEMMGKVDIAMSYRRIRHRKGENVFGLNDHSWNLQIDYEAESCVWHNRKKTVLPGRRGVSSGVFSGRKGRVGVFLDWEGGALSFYDIIIMDKGLTSTPSTAPSLSSCCLGLDWLGLGPLCLWLT